MKEEALMDQRSRPLYFFLLTLNSERPSSSSSHLTGLVIVIAFSAVNPANGKDALTTDLDESIPSDSDGQCTVLS